MENKASIFPIHISRIDKKFNISVYQCEPEFPAIIIAWSWRQIGQLLNGFSTRRSDLRLAVRLSPDAIPFIEDEITDVSPLANLTQLKDLNLYDNQITDVSALVRLTKLETLMLIENPDLTYAQISELRKALPDCEIHSSASPF